VPLSPQIETLLYQVYLVGAAFCPWFVSAALLAFMAIVLWLGWLDRERNRQTRCPICRPCEHSRREED
jgi:hypothetical protein